MSIILFSVSIIIIGLLSSNCVHGQPAISQETNSRSFIPQTEVTVPDYFCTWRTQRMRLRPEQVPVGAVQNDIRVPMRDNLTEAVLFGESGWVTTLYASVRKSLLFILDDGWDVPLGTNTPQEKWRFGSLIPDEGWFPSLKGTLAEKLLQLRQKVTQAGWKGLGLWVAAQQAGEGQPDQPVKLQQAEAYWRERARWCHQAGITYWKVDWGTHDHDLAYRAMITRVTHGMALKIIYKQDIK